MDDTVDYELRTLRIRARRFIKDQQFHEAQELYRNALEIVKKRGDKRAIASFENIIFKIGLDKILVKIDRLKKILNDLTYNE
ncbi:MAG: hypothetical protein ACTSWR_01730 [Candidatus Helarchaeota archaeon]